MGSFNSFNVALQGEQYGDFCFSGNHNILNTELAIHALDQVHCWDTYFRLRIGHYGNFTPLNFQPLLLSKQ
jgi:hypothetical protein